MEFRLDINKGDVALEEREGDASDGGTGESSISMMCVVGLGGANGTALDAIAVDVVGGKVEFAG